MSKLFCLFLMLFAHIVDDYYLQGILASMKQKHWWKENFPDKMYQHDYLVALAMHSFSWSFMIMLPVAAFYWFNPPVAFFGGVIANTMIHFFVDDLKANRKSINLIADQTLHVAQVLWTALLFLN